MRKIAAKNKNTFEKDFFKLMNVSIYGKTMENLKKRINVQLVSDEKKHTKLIAKPHYLGEKIFNEDLVAVHLQISSLKLDMPIYVGFCILELSKYIMYDFHYNNIKKKYGDKAKLLFTDTDSLCYHIKTDDLYTEMYKDKQAYDFSEYPEESMFYNQENSAVLGKLKDETHGTQIKEFVGLKPKMYSVLRDDDIQKKAAKGCIENNEHVVYKHVLFEKEKMYSTVKSIRSYGHELFTIETNKIS